MCIKQSRADIVGMLICSLGLISSKNALYSLNLHTKGVILISSEEWNLGDCQRVFKVLRLLEFFNDLSHCLPAYIVL